MRTDSRRKPGAHRAQLAPKGLLARDLRIVRLPIPGLLPLQDALVGLLSLRRFPQKSHLQIRTMAASWSASGGGAGRRALLGPSVELQD